MTLKLGWTSLLGILFVALKLTGHVAWSWWWVLAPFWAPIALVAVLMFGVALGVIVWSHP